MMQEVVNNREAVSALVDGQLQGDELDRAAQWASQDPDGPLTWQAYHVVGEVLRTGALVAGDRDAEFMARWKLRLQQESVYLRQSETPNSIAAKVMDEKARGQNSTTIEAANDATYRWKRLAGFASVMAVVSVGFLASGLGDDQRGAPQLAQGMVEAARPGPDASTATGPDSPAVMIRDSELDALLAAHRQLGGTTAFQVPTGFLRNATFEGGGR